MSLVEQKRVYSRGVVGDCHRRIRRWDKMDLTDVPDHAGISCVDDLLVDEEERERGKGISQGEACYFM